MNDFYSGRYRTSHLLEGNFQGSYPLEVKGVIRHFNLGLLDDYVAFRAEDGTGLWLCTEPVISSVAIEEFWRCEVAAGRFGSLFTEYPVFQFAFQAEFATCSMFYHQPKLGSRDNTGYTFPCICAVQNDNLGIAREWHGGKWHKLPSPKLGADKRRGTKFPTIWDRASYFPLLKSQLNGIKWQLALGNQYPEFEEWRNKSLPQLIRNLRAALIWSQLGEIRQDWRRPEHTYLVQPRVVKFEIRYPHVPARPAAELGCPLTNPNRDLSALLQIFTKHLAPPQWRSPFKDETGYRLPAETVQVIGINVANEVAPTMHDRIEAGVTLQHWLRDKVSEAEIHQLLPDGL